VVGGQRARLHRADPDHHAAATWPSRAPGGRGVGRRPDHRAGHLRHDPRSSRPAPRRLHATRYPSSSSVPTSRGSTGSACTRWAPARPAGRGRRRRARTFCPYVPPRTADAPRPHCAARCATRCCTPRRRLADVDEWVETAAGEGGPLVVDPGLRAGRGGLRHLAGRPARPRRRRRSRRATPPASWSSPEAAGAGEGTTGTAPTDDASRVDGTADRPRPAQGTPAAVAEPWLAQLNRPSRQAGARACRGATSTSAAAAKRTLDVYDRTRGPSGTSSTSEPGADDPGHSRPRLPRRRGLALAAPRPRCWSPTAPCSRRRRPAWRRTPAAGDLLLLGRAGGRSRPRTTRSHRWRCGQRILSEAASG
jgi:hypothetical protein